jgi:hypothetical protein
MELNILMSPCQSDLHGYQNDTPGLAYMKHTLFEVFLKSPMGKMKWRETISLFDLGFMGIMTPPLRGSIGFKGEHRQSP